ADQFQMEFVVDQSEKYLIQSKGFNEVQKLLFADKYRLSSLKSSSEYDNISAETKVLILDKLIKP
ncbi:hypothetical protein PMAYCL1PPCAC_25532, partial [Pristionchus mayeri]